MESLSYFFEAHQSQIMFSAFHAAHVRAVKLGIVCQCFL